jgi:class 3 adenylate cyclase
MLILPTCPTYRLPCIQRRSKALERKLVAILAAGVVGYSRLMHENEERTLATLTSHREIIDSLIATGNGEISGTAGDSILAEFPSALGKLHAEHIGAGRL